MNVPRVRIAIDPQLKAQFGPEICWTWQYLLSGIGFAWQEVPLGHEDCDIVYGLPSDEVPPCRLFVRGTPEKWNRLSELRLAGVECHDGLACPTYEGEPVDSHPVQDRDGTVVCTRDIILDVFWMASGQEERNWPKNRHGHLNMGGTVFDREDVVRRAVGTDIATWLEKTFERLGFPTPLPRWPNGKRAAACLSHDVDYPEAVKWLEPLRILYKQGPAGLSAAWAIARGTRTHWHFSSWMDLERRFGVRSAFYFVARKGSLLEYAAGSPDPFYDIGSRHFRSLFRQLSEAGFEIGLHASYRAHASLETLAGEKQRLCELSGQRILGNRHHYWHIDGDDPEATLLMHEQVGLKLDTSLSNERYVGWRRGLSWPFFPFHQQQRRALETLQITTTWMDDHLFRHRAYNPGPRREVLEAMADVAVQQGGCLCTDVHNYVYDDVLFPDFRETYTNFLEHLVARSEFWIDTPTRVASHWAARHLAITQASEGLSGELEPRSRVDTPKQSGHAEAPV